MEVETMEYSINQTVIFELDGKRTGKITGHSGDNFIITLDLRLGDGSKTVLMPSDAVFPLSCHWCRDTKKVAVTPFTIAQYEAGTIPQKDCPYCVEEFQTAVR